MQPDTRHVCSRSDGGLCFFYSYRPHCSLLGTDQAMPTRTNAQFSVRRPSLRRVRRVAFKSPPFSLNFVSATLAVKSNSHATTLTSALSTDTLASSAALQASAQVVQTGLLLCSLCARTASRTCREPPRKMFCQTPRRCGFVCAPFSGCLSVLCSLFFEFRDCRICFSAVHRLLRRTLHALMQACFRCCKPDRYVLDDEDIMY